MAVVEVEVVAEGTDLKPATNAVVVRPVVDARVANSLSTTTNSQHYEQAEVNSDIRRSQSSACVIACLTMQMTKATLRVIV